MTTSGKGYTLNKAIYPNMIHYPPDGYGRDSYIHNNNGGFWRDNYQENSGVNKYDVPKYRNYHSLKKNVASVTYHSDGSGRDTYVTHESGGLEKEYTPLKHFHLKEFLRIPGGAKFNFKTSPMKEGVSYKTPYVSKQEINRNLKIKKLETGLLNRLYYSEKHKFSPVNSKDIDIKSPKYTLPPLLTENNKEDKKEHILKQSNLTFLPLTPKLDICPKLLENNDRFESKMKNTLKIKHDSRKSNPNLKIFKSG